MRYWPLFNDHDYHSNFFEVDLINLQSLLRGGNLTTIPAAQANEAAEVAVRTMKRILRNCQASSKDPFIALLKLKVSQHQSCLKTTGQRHEILDASSRQQAQTWLCRTQV